MAPTSGTLNPRKAFITNRALKTTETEAPLEFEVALKMRNFSELQNRINQGEQIPLQEMVTRYEPLPGDYQKVVDWITSQGLTITHQDNHHMAVFAKGKVSQIQKAMGVSFAHVAMDGKGTHFFSCHRA